MQIDFMTRRLRRYIDRVPMVRLRKQVAFTLVELLIAMTITLLLMAALGKAFAVIGATMKTGRSQVTLSGKLRSLSFRLRSDLRNRTVEAKPITPGTKGGEGYFTYYEGPLTEQTWGLYGSEAVRFNNGATVLGADAAFATLDNSPTYRRHGRFGDLDDYVAFTAKAPSDSWFTGKVPRYLVDDSVDANTNGVLDVGEQAAAMQPVVIRSKFAEIIIWAEPEYVIDPVTQTLVIDAASGVPRYKDEDNNYVPDSVTLHQRILLIRPDLNVRGTIPSSLSFTSDFLRPVLGDVTSPALVPTALQSIYPIGMGNPSATPTPIPAYYPSYVATNTNTTPGLHFNSHWLMGMTPVHHFFDLSLRRIVDPLTGEPTPYVAANTLADLTEPHNRFAAVRYPGRFFGYGAGAVDNATSMPLLAMAWNPAVLQWNTPDARGGGTAPAWFPTGYPPLTTQNNLIRNNLFNGWLIPHFTLGDPNPTVTGVERWQRGYLTTADSRWDRTGEDVLAGNVLAFDVKGFDTTAPVFLAAGLDGEPGKAGVDDDGNDAANPDLTVTVGAAPAQVLTELGAVGSDDVVVRVGDLAIEPLLTQAILDPRDADLYAATPALLAGRHRQMIATTGDFVDLLYPYLSGGPMLDMVREATYYRPPGPNATTPPLGSAPTSRVNVNNNFNSLLESQLSGYPVLATQLAPLKSSGKLVHTSATGAYRYFQPCYDTWTSGYEADGFDQTQDTSGVVTGTPGTLGTVWVLNNYDSTASNISSRLSRLPTPVAQPAAFSVDTGRHDATQPECLPPVLAELPAISITVRIDDPVGGEIAEITVIENLID